MSTTAASSHHTDDVLAATEGQREAATDDPVRKSWIRSASQYGIDPASDRSPHLLTERELRGLREPITQSLDVARVELDHLYKLVRPANYVILLCDNNGVVVDHRGEETEAQQFKYWGTWLGGVWSEDVEGTNGIGTCIAEQRAVTVHRNQHFRSRHINLSCSGAPIFGANGEIAGVLDVSSIDPRLSEHAHALTGALTIDVARAIEERIFREAFRRDWIVAVRLPETLGSTMLLAVDHDQRIVGADRVGRSVLAQWGHNLANGVGMSGVFARNDVIGRRKHCDDVWTLIQPHGTGAAWPAIVTSPDLASNRRKIGEMDDLHRRPRLDMLTAGPWAFQAAPVARGGLSPATLRRVREYIDAHMSQNIELKPLAETAGLSMYHFARAFKQSEGITPHDYILERRIGKARELLHHSDITLSQVASAAGFADQSHFTRRFRQAVGMSPGQFRRSRQ